VSLGANVTMQDTHASGCTWSFGELFGVGAFDIRDQSCGGGGYEFNTSATAFRSIFSSNNTADRTYTFPNNTGTLAELGLAQTWSALQTFTPGIATGSSAPACTAGTGGFGCFAEGTAPTNVASTDAIYADSTAHSLKASFNNTAFHRIAVTEFGTCTMSAATTCTFTAGAAFSGTPLGFASIANAATVPATANSAKCSISGTTVT